MLLKLDMSHWQIVFRYEAYQELVLLAATGAIAVSYGSPEGAPVRLVDSWEVNGPGAGGWGWAVVGRKAGRRDGWGGEAADWLAVYKDATNDQFDGRSSTSCGGRFILLALDTGLP